ncbi:DUF4145 domain-containing protein [Notoacmeibacter sp. MSK16QG-6]|uniref:DUF4145 domain-containing protein n=1 Tax=Notoacmeibacter sp. MSK16QG-6 TaxID=2957982 RepID=UPI00209E8FEA|nr:DUF4145 domain-containing protein [Notoacmeibacter sp. MSK16QG-6]MCP1198993.1 DUF4145 domain-containing protein [Notoacmeibacter sp. MSK16QG-6]
MSSADRLRADCPECGTHKWLYVKATYDQALKFEQTDIYINHFILECAGCESVVYVRRSADSEFFYISADGEQELEVTQIQFPKVSPDGHESPKWLPELLYVDKTLFKVTTQTYDALSAGSLLFASVGFRTIFDYGSTLLGADSSLSFSGKLSKLVSLGKIGAEEKINLETVVEAGNASIHRAWQPKGDDIRVLRNVSDAFVYRNFILNRDVLGISKKIPPKKRLGPLSS